MKVTGSISVTLGLSLRLKLQTRSPEGAAVTDATVTFSFYFFIFCVHKLVLKVGVSLHSSECHSSIVRPTLPSLIAHEMLGNCTDGSIS